MIRILLTLLISITYTLSYAHNAQEAIFNIKNKANNIEISAEFPWTIRKALLTEYPDLENNTNQIAFDHVFFNYVKSNLILSNKNHDTLRLLTINKIESSESHHNHYVFTYQKLDYNTIKNTLLFNINTKQVNIHNFTKDKQLLVYKTNPSSPSFDISPLKEKDNIWTVFVTCIGIGLIVLMFKQAFTKAKPNA